MKKIIIVLSVLLAVCLAISAVSADEGWSFNFSSEESSSSSSNGGEVNFNNGKLKIQGLEFTIPEGYKENDTAKKVGEEADQKAFPDFSISIDQFDKGNDSIIVKVVFGAKKLDNNTYTPNSDSQSKKIAGHDGYFVEYKDGVSFTYLEDGKLVEIFAPDENVLSSVMNK